MTFSTTGKVSTELLDIGFEAAGPRDGPTAVLLHGFPYDVRSYDGVAARLSAQGVRVIASARSVAPP